MVVAFDPMVFGGAEASSLLLVGAPLQDGGDNGEVAGRYFAPLPGTSGVNSEPTWKFHMVSGNSGTLVLR
jgi:hypothetical protein